MTARFVPFALIVEIPGLGEMAVGLPIAWLELLVPAWLQRTVSDL